eukprot:ctg_312.g159
MGDAAFILCGGICCGTAPIHAVHAGGGHEQHAAYGAACSGGELGVCGSESSGGIAAGAAECAGRGKPRHVGVAVRAILLGGRVRFWCVLLQRGQHPRSAARVRAGPAPEHPIRLAVGVRHRRRMGAGGAVRGGEPAGERTVSGRRPVKVTPAPLRTPQTLHRRPKKTIQWRWPWLSTATSTDDGVYACRRPCSDEWMMRFVWRPPMRIALASVGPLAFTESATTTADIAVTIGVVASAAGLLTPCSIAGTSDRYKSAAALGSSPGKRLFTSKKAHASSYTHRAVFILRFYTGSTQQRLHRAPQALAPLGSASLNISQASRAACCISATAAAVSAAVSSSPSSNDEATGAVSAAELADDDSRSASQVIHTASSLALALLLLPLRGECRSAAPSASARCMACGATYVNAWKWASRCGLSAKSGGVRGDMTARSSDGRAKFRALLGEIGAPLSSQQAPSAAPSRALPPGATAPRGTTDAAARAPRAAGAVRVRDTAIAESATVPRWSGNVENAALPAGC